MNSAQKPHSSLPFLFSTTPFSDNNISENIVALIQKEVRRNNNPVSIKEKKKEIKLKRAGLVKTHPAYLLFINFIVFPLLSERLERDGREQDFRVAQVGLGDLR